MKNKLKLNHSALIEEISKYAKLYPRDIKLWSVEKSGLIIGIHNPSGRFIAVAINDKPRNFIKKIRDFNGIAIRTSSVEDFKRQMSPYLEVR